ncbi:MAG: menaquinone biosynthesis protein [Verrucomicrobia bacterium]|nr:menaquinone biosynthesis protein [Verrucomicrobiota bacterium]
MRAPRLGCVPYLNARPLIHGLEATLEVPAVLSRRFLAGDFDAALIPAFEMLRLPAPRIADGFGICSVGAVRSVIVAHRHPLDQTPEIVLDPTSRTSVHLLQILLSEHLKNPARLVDRSEDPQAARLIIGDPALRFQETMDPGWRIFDLGQAWHKWTGLPFVYAVWTLADNAPAGTADLLRQAAVNGLAARPAISAKESDPAAALDYLTHSIHFPIGPDERAGVEEFRRHLVSHGLLPAEAGAPVYV